MRDPKHPGWPRKGEGTEFEDVARRWAWKYVDALLDEKHRRQTGRASKSESFGKAKERYLRHRARQVEHNTLLNDRVALGHLERAIGERAPVDTVTSDALQRWFDARLDEGYKPLSLERYRMGLSAFFAFVGGANPAGEVKLPRQDERDARAWTDAELARLRKAATKLGTDYRVFLELGICTGGRYRELLALRWEDFDARKHTVRFQRQTVTEDPERTKGLKGKQNRTALVLPAWWPFHQRRKFGAIVSVKRPMVAILKAAKIKEPGILNHALRHSYARVCLENGVSLDVLKKYLGHASIQTTENEYGWMREEVAVQMGQRAFYA